MNKLFAALLISLVVLLGLGFFVFSGNNNNEAVTYENIAPQELRTYLDSNKDIYLLDVHIPEQQHIQGTDEFIPFNEIVANKSKLPKNKNTEIVVYCRSGNMSETAAEELIDMGYTNVKNLTGGTNTWFGGGFNNE